MNDKQKTVLDILLDENNNDPIVLFNEEGEEIAFEQIAIIPLDEELYAILKPVKPMEGVGENEWLAFLIDIIDDRDCNLTLVTEEEILDKVFNVYEELIAAEGLN